MKRIFQYTWLHLSIIAAIIVLASLACRLPFLPFLEGKESGESITEEDYSFGKPTGAGIAPLASDAGIDLGGATLDGVTSTSEGFTAGQILSVKVTNPGNSPITVTIPCGQVFNPPPGTGEQMLMVVQPVMEEIPAGGTVELQPYVVCIESSASVPGEGSAYQVGLMAEGSLFNLADCFCRERLSPDPTAFQEMMGVQFATWMVADGVTADEFSASPGEGAGAEMMQFFSTVMGSMAEPAQEWLDKCEIEQK
jgi:hypothetical protein